MRVSLPLRGKQGVFSLKKFAYVSLRDIKALWAYHDLTAHEISLEKFAFLLIGKGKACLEILNFGAPDYSSSPTVSQ